MLKSKIFYMLTTVFIFSNINSCHGPYEEYNGDPASANVSSPNSQHSSSNNFRDYFYTAVPVVPNNTPTVVANNIPVNQNNPEERISFIDRLVRKVLKFVHFSN